MRRRAAASLALLATPLLTSCGGASKPSKPAPERVCGGSQRAAARVYGHPLRMRIASRNPIQLECVLAGHGVKVRVSSQTTPDAYTEFNIQTSHQDQVYGPGVHTPSQIPVKVTVPGTVVSVWIPAQREIIATNAQPGGAGTYLTVTVGGAEAAGKTRAKALALAVARAVIAAHPGEK